MKNAVKKSLAAALALTMALGASTSLVACGEYELTSIVVAQTSIDTEYVIGENVSFDGIVIKAKFNDGTEQDVALTDCKVFLGDEEITSNLSKITESLGTKSVVIKYEDKSTTVEIRVVVEGGETAIVSSYEAPQAYASYKANTVQAGTKAYGEEDYEAQFTTGDATAEDYLVGDDNPFKFLPRLTYFMDDNNYGLATKFRSDSALFIWDSEEFDELDSRVGTVEDTVEYYDGETVYATAYVATNEYTFTQAALDKKFKLSVLPASNYVYDNPQAVDCVFTVIDGYNVYTAKQLAVIDNGEDFGERKDSVSGDYFWADIKQEQGLTGINPKAVILQNDISVTANDIPSYFTYTLTEDVNYYHQDDLATKANPVAGNKTFLREKISAKESVHDNQTSILLRRTSGNESFGVYGNYHTLDLKNLPLVCSFNNEYADGFGQDGSNATFLRVEGKKFDVGTDEGVSHGNFKMQNLNVVGNGNINPLMDEEGKHVYAGGIIFNKDYGITTTIDNVMVRTTFFALVPESGANAVVKNSKIYDSYSSAVYTYNKTVLSIENSNLERAGGPLILSMQNGPEKAGADNRVPYITADENTILKNYVTGQEFWFVSYGANQVVQMLDAVNPNFAAFYRSLKKDGKFNLIYLAIPSGTDVTTIVGNCTTQCYFAYGGTALDRIANNPTDHLMGYQTSQVLKQAAAAQKVGMTFNAGTSFGYMNADNTPNVATSAYAGFAAANYIALNYGGMGVLFEFFSTAPAQPQE